MQDPQWYAPPGAPAPEHPAQGEDVGARLEPGGFGIRFGAHFIDVIATSLVGGIAGFAGGVLVGVLGAAGVIGAGWQHRLGKLTAGSFVMGLVASLAYHTIAEAVGGATVGKAICGLRVITEDRRPCTFLKSLGRNLAYYIDALFFGLVAWSAMSKSMMQQRHGDKWAGTVVVFARGVPASAQRSPAVGIVLGLGIYGLVQLIASVVKVF
jgi:uncharacterized RDD family membrane protein YckC